MAQERENRIVRAVQTAATAGKGSQIDYSYNQWRQARMRQLERDYEVECEGSLRGS